MNNKLNREILRLSLPSILANITVPLVGMVDTALAGHLGGGMAAAAMGAISVGAMMLNLLYWSFGFLRTGTGGLTAQAFGRQAPGECAMVFKRGMLLAAGIAVLMLLLQTPFARLTSHIAKASPEVSALAIKYFFIRIWAAPATLSLMVLRGWFVGMQDSMSSMWTDLTVNTVNIAASVILCFGAFGWSGMGFEGIATGTVVAQYAGLLFAGGLCLVKYRGVMAEGRNETLASLLSPSALSPFLLMNGRLMGRSLCMTAIYMGYTFIAAGFGDVLLACSSIMMHLLMLFSYFTDGFAYAGEALTGRFIGAGDNAMLKLSVKYVFAWSMGIAALSTIFYQAFGRWAIGLFTTDTAVVEACAAFIPWLVAMPLLGCAAFTWDGIFLGATDSWSLMWSLVAAAAGFFGTWYAFSPLAEPGTARCLHILLAAYFVHLAARTVWLSAAYRSRIRPA